MNRPLPSLTAKSTILAAFTFIAGALALLQAAVPTAGSLPLATQGSLGTQLNELA